MSNKQKYMKCVTKFLALSDEERRGGAGLALRATATIAWGLLPDEVAKSIPKEKRPEAVFKGYE